MKKITYFILVLLLVGCTNSSEIKVFTDYEKGLKNAAEEGQSILLVFDFFGNPTMSAKQILFDKQMESVLSDFTVVLLNVDAQNSKGEYNRALQKLKFGTDSQPMYYLLDDKEKVIKGPKGYCKKEEFLKFIL